jgi:hypothetical protein
MKIKSYLLKMPEQLHKDLKQLAVNSEISMQDEMITAISDYVEKRKSEHQEQAV